MKHKKIEFSYILSLAVATFLFAGVSAVLAWTPAPANPPLNNVEAPINVSNSPQNKLGNLGLGGLVVFGKFQLIDGTQGAGKVLVSDANGKASWQTIPWNTSTTNTVQQACSATVSLNLENAAGNNSAAMKKIGELQPGTYTVSGSGSTYNTGGGGTVAVFLSTDNFESSDFNNPKVTKILSGYGSCTGCTVNKPLTYVTGPIVVAVNRNGYNDTKWTMPSNSKMNVTQKSNVYIYSSQGGSTGNLSLASTDCN